MDATVNSQNEQQAGSPDHMGEKSELMQIFEMQVKDAYWAYKDLLREIMEGEGGDA